LNYEQTVNGLGKLPGLPFSVFRLMFPFLHVAILHVSISLFPEFRTRKTELTEDGNFCLLAANGKLKRKTSVCVLKTGTRKQKFVFLDRQTINGNRQLIFQQTHPSVLTLYCTVVIVSAQAEEEGRKKNLQ
jgi:hypothetical protein